MTNRNETKGLTRAQKRVLALISERPGAFLSEYRGSYYVHDAEDGLWESRTSLGCVRGLIERSLISEATIDRSHLATNERQLAIHLNPNKTCDAYCFRCARDAKRLKE